MVVSKDRKTVSLFEYIFEDSMVYESIKLVNSENILFRLYLKELNIREFFIFIRFTINASSTKYFLNLFSL